MGSVLSVEGLAEALAELSLPKDIPGVLATSRDAHSACLSYVPAVAYALTRPRLPCQCGAVSLAAEQVCSSSMRWPVRWRSSGGARRSWLGEP